MNKNKFLMIGIVATSLILSSCDSKNSEKTEQKDSTSVPTEVAKTASAIDYSGVYSITDQSVCDLEIVISKKDNNFAYSSGKAKGSIEVINQDGEVYLKMIAINGDSPNGDVEAKYEDETLLIQNEGNAMNPYSIFKKCDAKFLELKKKK